MTKACSLALIGATLCACASKDQTTLGDTTVGMYSLHVFREGPACTAGAMTTMVVKPTAGGKPASIVGWVGLADTDEAAKVMGDFDAADGDFDFAVTCPTPVPAGAKFYFVLDGNLTGSVDLK